MTETKLDFESALRRVIADLKAPKGQYNSFGKYKYRNAEDILEAVKPLLIANHLRLKLSDVIVSLDGRFYVEASVTVIGHGEQDSVTAYAREEESKKGMDGAQVTGAASSYARKYALNGMFDIDDTKDADSQDNTRAKAEKHVTDEQKQRITKLLVAEGIRIDQIPALLEKEYGVNVGNVMSFETAEKIIKDLES